MRLVFSFRDRERSPAQENPEKDAPPNLVRFFMDGEPKIKREEVVVPIKVLSGDVNNCYGSFRNSRITHVNGRKIKNLRELIRIVEDGSKDTFVVFKNEEGSKMVLERKIAEKGHDKILRTYKISADRSVDLQ